jgi:hypothetical protein
MSIVVPLPTDFKKPKPLPGHQNQVRTFPAETLAQRVARVAKELTGAATRQLRQRLRQEARRQERRDRRRPTTVPIAYLRARTWKHMYATKVAGVGVRPRMRKEQFVVAWNTRRSGTRLSNWQLERHFAGDETYYFCACPNKRTERGWLMIGAGGGGEVGNLKKTTARPSFPSAGRLSYGCATNHQDVQV